MREPISDERFADIQYRLETIALCSDGEQKAVLTDAAAALRELQEFRQIRRILRDSTSPRPWAFQPPRQPLDA